MDHDAIVLEMFIEKLKYMVNANLQRKFTEFEGVLEGLLPKGMILR